MTKNNRNDVTFTNETNRHDARSVSRSEPRNTNMEIQ
jgi:hypothetical protein